MIAALPNLSLSVLVALIVFVVVVVAVYAVAVAADAVVAVYAVAVVVVFSHVAAAARHAFARRMFLDTFSAPRQTSKGSCSQYYSNNINLKINQNLNCFFPPAGALFSRGIRNSTFRH